jgi:tetratricopeptide (TPR) repeat protein
MEVIDKTLKSYKNDSTLLLYKGNCLYKMKKYKQAISILNKA